MFNPFSMAANAGQNLFGGLFDGKPGAFSQHPGGIADLWGNGLFAAQQGQAPDQVPAQAGQVPAPGRVSVGRTIADVLFNNQNPYDSIDRQRKRPEIEAAQAKLKEAAQGMNLTPEQRLWMAVDPEGFMRARNAPKDYNFFSSGGGDIVRVDPRTGQAEVAYDYTDPNADLTRAEIQARIDANKALVGQREASSRLSGVRADAGGYAPRTHSGGGVPRAAGGSAAPVTVSSPQQLAALPSGALFVGPDGKTRRKP